tara:strand:+ start:36777 stop:36968 length:192 start_codon:yes stop_codon:yes gene_type:complete
MSQRFTFKDDIGRALAATEIKNENGDRVLNLEYEGQDAKDFINISKGDLEQLLRDMYVMGAFQ